MVQDSKGMRAISNQLQLILTVRRSVNADRETDSRQTDITNNNILLLMPCRRLHSFSVKLATKNTQIK